MEIMNVLNTHFNCGPKSGAGNPHNLKCRNLPVSLAQPRPYLYSNTGISIKNRVRRKALTTHTLRSPKFRRIHFFLCSCTKFQRKCIACRERVSAIVVPPSGTTYRSPRLWVSVRRAAGPHLYPHVLRRLPPHAAAVSNTHKAYTATLFS